MNEDIMNTERVRLAEIAEKTNQEDIDGIIKKLKRKRQMSQGQVQPDIEQSENIVRSVRKVEKERKSNSERQPLDRHTDIRVDEDTETRLREFARRKGLIFSAAVRMLIIEGLDAHGA